MLELTECLVPSLLGSICWTERCSITLLLRLSGRITHINCSILLQLLLLLRGRVLGRIRHWGGRMVLDVGDNGHGRLFQGRGWYVD